MNDQSGEVPPRECFTVWWDDGEQDWIIQSGPDVTRLTVPQALSLLIRHQLLDPKQLSAEQFEAYERATRAE